MDINELHMEYINRYKEWELANATNIGQELVDNIWEIYTVARDKYFRAIAMRAN